MGRIKGITVILHQKKQTNTDDFNSPIYVDTLVKVENVLVVPSSATEITNELNLTGKKIACILCIPKGNADNWVDTQVDFFGQTWKTVGYPEEHIEELLPLEWNKKVMVERYG